jgi:hypothetical protein
MKFYQLQLPNPTREEVLRVSLQQKLLLPYSFSGVYTKQYKIIETTESATVSRFVHAARIAMLNTKHTTEKMIAS